MRSLQILVLSLVSATGTSAADATILCNSASSPPDWASYAITLKYSLNYDFVANNPKSAAQICQNGGPMVDNALGVTGARTWGIEPVDLSESLGYVASAMVVRAPRGFLDQLNDQLGNSTAPLYNHRDQIVRQLAQQIDDSFEAVLSESFEFLTGATLPVRAEVLE